jgi:hypothetical protein
MSRPPKVEKSRLNQDWEQIKSHLNDMLNFYKSTQKGKLVRSANVQGTTTSRPGTNSNGKFPKSQRNAANGGVNFAASGSFGSRIGRNQLSIVACDNLIADCTKVGGIRIRGHCYSNIGLGSVVGDGTGDHAAMFLDGAPHTGGGSTTLAWIGFSFQDFDDRIKALASVYQYYRVRRLTALYVPLVGSTQVGQWAFGILDNYNPVSGTAPQTINSLLTSEVSAAGSAWIEQTLPPYIYNGPKVWSCPAFAESATPNDYIQLAFLARCLVTDSTAVTLEYGRFQFLYDIEFFEPRANVGAIVLRKLSDPLPLPLVDSLLTKEEQKQCVKLSNFKEVVAHKMLALLEEHKLESLKDSHSSSKDEERLDKGGYTLVPTPISGFFRK